MTTMTFSEAKEIQRAKEWLAQYWKKPVDTEYVNVRSVQDALSLLQKYGNDAKIFAGGTDLIKLIKSMIMDPGVLINIKPIRSLKGISVQDETVTIGALSHINDIESSSLIQVHYPMFYEAAHSIASPQIRNMASVAGNLCQETRCWYYRRSPDTGISFNCRRKGKDGICYALDGENQYHAINGRRSCVSVCPSDMATVFTAMDAKLNVIGINGEQSIPIAKFYTDMGHVLNHNEIITAVQVPRAGTEVKQKFLKFRIRKAIDFAIVSVAAVIKFDNDHHTIEDARIVLGGVASKPYRALEAEQNLLGKQLTKSLVEKSARAATSQMRPLQNNNYKLPILETLVKRALLSFI